MFLLLITQLNDVAQYVFGKCFGRRPIAPRVSPGKTVEGFAGGVVVSSVTASWIGPLLTPMDPVMSLVAGAVLGGAGFGGDMAVSAIKRDSQVKDTGRPAPGSRRDPRPDRQPARGGAVLLLFRLFHVLRGLTRS